MPAGAPRYVGCKAAGPLVRSISRFSGGVWMFAVLPPFPVSLRAGAATWRASEDNATRGSQSSAAPERSDCCNPSETGHKNLYRNWICVKYFFG